MADSTLSQYTDLYLQTSKEYLQALNHALLTLEKEPSNQTAIEEIFRNAHTLKSQSAAMGFEQTGFLCHAVEDVFFEIKQGSLQVTPELADELFSAFDGLTQSIARIEAEGTETDLSSLAEKLKQLTGVTTVGAGKSQRTRKTFPYAAGMGSTCSSSQIKRTDDSQYRFLIGCHRGRPWNRTECGERDIP